MNISEDILNTGRNITGDRLYYLQLILLKSYTRRKTTCVGTIISNRKSLPAALRAEKERQVLSSELMWKNNNPVKIVLSYPKVSKNVLLVLTAHSEPDVCKEIPKKLPLLTFLTVTDVG